MIKLDEILKFDENNSFNNEILHQYDLEGQKGFLGYLLQNSLWNIVNNQIIFPNIKTSEEIEKLLIEYDTDVKKRNISIQKDILDKIMVLGFSRTKDMIDDDVKEIESRENKSKNLER